MKGGRGEAIAVRLATDADGHYESLTHGPVLSGRMGPALQARKAFRFLARAATSQRSGQHRSLALRQRLIKGVGDHVEKLCLEPLGEKREVIEVRVLLRVQMPR